MSAFKVRAIESSEEESRLRDLATQAFDFPESSWDEFCKMISRHDLRVAYAGDEMVGGLSYYPVGQWFAGKSVPMAGLALVLMAPEHRGHGYGFRMVAEVLRELRATFPISTLYPSTMAFYRRLGYEQAGNSYDYYASLRDIGGCRPMLPLRRVDADEHNPLFQSIATRQAEFSNGGLDRNPGMWRRIFRPRDGGKVFSYLVGAPGEEAGYLVYDQLRSPSRNALSQNQWEQRAIFVRDMVGLNAEAIQSIWSFIEGNRTVTQIVKWTGAASDLRNLVHDEFEAKVFRARRWMLRILDVKQALLRRGYPALDEEISFEIHDELIPENQGRFTLRVKSGKPELIENDPKQCLTVSVAGLAPLYSGLFTAEQLAAAGQIDCVDKNLLAAASRMFAASEPWMSDSF